MIFRRCSGASRAQDAISSIVRPHPMQRPEAASMLQIPMQGVSMPISSIRLKRGTLADSWTNRQGLSPDPFTMN
jgi:hypothetical protein